ncbi:MAG: hypothetical protein E6J20_19975 [Chloroflexi bacterium]|nr:MAG: hypothetical protein E6J20_19975 [Chloroflexota bacterium]
MSWTLSATGRLETGLEHLEEELHDALHKVLSDPRFGLLFSHFQGAVVDRLHTVGQAPAADPEPPAPPAVPPAEAEAAPAAEPAPETAAPKAPKAAAKTTAGG